MAVAACTPAAKAGRWTPTRPCGCSPALNPPTTPCWPPCTRPCKRAGPHWHPAPHCTGCTSAATRSSAQPAPWQARCPSRMWCRRTARATWCMCCAGRTTACSWTWPKAAAGCSATPRSTPACACSTCLPTPARFRWQRCAQARPRWSTWTWPGAHWPRGGRTTGSMGWRPAPCSGTTTSSAPGARSRATAPTAWSSSTRPATRKAASSPPRTTRA
jgi:hypothetical protein